MSLPQPQQTIVPSDNRQYTLVYNGNFFPSVPNVQIKGVWSGVRIDIYDNNGNLIKSATVPQGNIGSQGWDIAFSLPQTVTGYLVITQNLALLKSPTDNPLLFQSQSGWTIANGDKYTFLQNRQYSRPPISVGEQPMMVDGVSTLINSVQLKQALEEGRDVTIDNSTNDLK